jgi:hypothetical protein
MSKERRIAGCVFNHNESLDFRLGRWKPGRERAARILHHFETSLNRLFLCAKWRDSATAIGHIALARPETTEILPRNACGFIATRNPI